MRRFVVLDRGSDYLLPPSVEDWLPSNHLGRCVADCRMIASFWLRSGDCSSATRMLSFFESTKQSLSNTSIGLLRADCENRTTALQADLGRYEELLGLGGRTDGNRLAYNLMSLFRQNVMCGAVQSTMASGARSGAKATATTPMPIRWT